jgi:hypothetical protein
VLAYYPKSIIREVDATGSPARILEHILEEVVPIQEVHFHNPITGERIEHPTKGNGRHPAPIKKMAKARGKPTKATR